MLVIVTGTFASNDSTNDRFRNRGQNRDIKQMSVGQKEN